MAYTFSLSCHPCNRAYCTCDITVDNDEYITTYYIFSGMKDDFRTSWTLYKLFCCSARNNYCELHKKRSKICYSRDNFIVGCLRLVASSASSISLTFWFDKIEISLQIIYYFWFASETKTIAMQRSEKSIWTKRWTYLHKYMCAKERYSFKIQKKKK